MGRGPDMPAWIEETLLVLEAFNDPRSGFEYRRGDRVQLRHRSVRETALTHPDWFAVEYPPEPVDVDWLREVDERFEAEFDVAMQARSKQKEQKERALRHELEHQDEPQPDLERRFKKQEKEDQRWRKERREQREREQVEAQPSDAARTESGFLYTQ